MKMPIPYGVIGAGVRTGAVLKHLAPYRDSIELRAVFDPVPERMEALKNTHGGPATVLYDNYADLVADPGIEWVFVMSPNNVHRKQIEAAFAAGKHVFSEKPLATTQADVLAIARAHRAAKGRRFATGFVLRYSPVYRKAKELITAGAIGKVIAIEANENISPQHSGHIMTCWKRYQKLSGGHMLEKCVHDLDLLNWLIESVPSRVASFGGLNIFRPENRANQTKFTPAPGKDSVYLEWPMQCRDTQDVFGADIDNIDNQVSILEYRNEVRVSFHVTMNNALPERRMYITGTEGGLIVDVAKGVELRRIGYDEPRQVFDLAGMGEMHGGGDAVMARELATAMESGCEAACGGQEGVLATLTAISVETARKERAIVDLEPLWKELELIG